MTIGSNTSGHFFDTSLNADGVLYANGTGVITSTTVGTGGQVLTSNGVGVAPTFQAVTAGVSGPGSSTNNSIATWNGAGGTALFSRGTPLIDSTGRMTNTNQPAWSAKLSGNVSAVTGDGTDYKIVFNTATFDQGSNFNTGTGVYTFPVAGIYQINVLYFMFVSSGASTSTQMLGYALVNGATNIRVADNNPNSLGLLVAQEFMISQSFLYKAAASDTMEIHVVLSNGTKNIGVGGGTQSCLFSGYLVC